MELKELKEKMDEAVYNMINAHKQQLELLDKLDYAGKFTCTYPAYNDG